MPVHMTDNSRGGFRHRGNQRLRESNIYFHLSSTSLHALTFSEIPCLGYGCWKTVAGSPTSTCSGFSDHSQDPKSKFQGSL